MFGGLGPLEIIVLLVIFFVLFGAERLPKMANALGRSKGEFQKGLDQSTKAMKIEETKAADAFPLKKKLIFFGVLDVFKILEYFGCFSAFFHVLDFFGRFWTFRYLLCLGVVFDRPSPIGRT